VSEEEWEGEPKREAGTRSNTVQAHLRAAGHGRARASRTHRRRRQCPWLRTLACRTPWRADLRGGIIDRRERWAKRRQVVDRTRGQRASEGQPAESPRDLQDPLQGAGLRGSEDSPQASALLASRAKSGRRARPHCSRTARITAHQAAGRGTGAQ
jgi:hypothetical protein